MILNKEHLIYTELVEGRIVSYYFVPNSASKEIEIWEYYPETAEAQQTVSISPESELEHETFIELYERFAASMREKTATLQNDYILN